MNPTSPTPELDIDGNVLDLYVIRDNETGEIHPDRFPYEEAHAEAARFDDATVIRIAR